MAILQEANAVFYHPLDDATEALQTQPWSGPATFGPGTVSDALGPAPGAASLTTTALLLQPFGAESEFLSANAADVISATALSATKFVVAYRDTASNSGKARIGTVSGSDITYGTETEFEAGVTEPDIAVAVLSATVVVVAFRQSSSGAGLTKVGTVAGTTMTFGSAEDIVTPANIIAVTALSATKFVVAYQDGANLNRGTTKVGTVAGTTITFGAPTLFTAATSSPTISVATLSATVFIVAAQYTFSGYVRVGTVSGTDITFGAEALFKAGILAQLSAVALSATKFVVVYRDDTDSLHGTAKVGTVSGTDITYGAEAEFNSAGATGEISATAISSQLVAIVYADPTDSTRGKARVGTIAGTSIVFGAVKEFNSAGATGNTSTASLSATDFVVAYADGADSGHGTAKVGQLAAYPTAIGATRLAFSGWAKSPNIAPPTTTVPPTTTTAPPLTSMAVGGSESGGGSDWIVGWRDSTGALKAQRSSTTGLTGSPFTVAAAGTEITIAGSESGGGAVWLIGWRDSTGALKGQTSSASGLTGSPFTVSALGSNISLAGTQSGGGAVWMVGWRDDSTGELKAQTLSGSGLTGSPFTVSAAGTDISVAGTESGGGAVWLVCWRDGAGALKAQTMSGSNLTGSPFTVDATGTEIAVAAPENGAPSLVWLIGWRDAGGVLKAQTASNSNLTGSSFTVDATGSDIDLAASRISSAAVWLIAWRDTSNVGTVQRSSQSNLVGSPFTVPA